jgi:nicotinamidase-related amidase
MRRQFPSDGSVLLLIDLQKAIDHPSWGERNNPSAETMIARLLAHWRSKAWPVWHVRHDSTHPDSHYRPGQPGNEFKPQLAPVAGEPVIVKRTNSAFIGTDLEPRLRADSRNAIVIAGVITNNSVAYGWQSGLCNLSRGGRMLYLRSRRLERHVPKRRRCSRNVACQS